MQRGDEERGAGRVNPSAATTGSCSSSMVKSLSAQMQMRLGPAGIHGEAVQVLRFWVELIGELHQNVGERKRK